MSNFQRAWVRQPSGRHLDLVNPSSEGFTDCDLAAGLAKTFRWGGHSIWANPLSVAQHSLLVLEIYRGLRGDKPSRHDELRELIHDAEEGLVGFDPISPLKPFLGDAFAQVMDRLQTAVFSKYGVQQWTPEEKKLHKQADILAAASEAVHIAGWSRQEVREVLGISVEPLEVDPLARLYGRKDWEPWGTDAAKERFLAELRKLSTSV